MKSTIKVSISSVAFNLEDDAYQLLKDYLDKLAIHFSKNEEGTEIIEDIEARLAELLLAKIKTPEQSVTAKDVSEVIVILGKPEELNDDSNTSTKSNSIPYTPSISAKKRLYRDPDNQILSGVCGGLGIYFNVDPVIFRILFAVLTISSPFFWPLNLGAIAVVAYVILWICLPKALTMAQKLEMQGESPSIANVERKMREEATKSPAQSPPRRNIIGRLIRVAFYVFAAIIAIPVICVGIALIVAVIAVAFAGGWVLQDSIFPLMDFVAISGASLTAIKILALVVAVIPLLLLVYAGIRLLFRFKAKSRGLVLSMVVIWVLAIFGLIGVGAYALKDYRNGAEVTIKEELTTIANTLYIRIPQNFDENNTRFYVGWSNNNRHPHIPHLWLSGHEDVLSVFPSIDIFYSNDSTFNISYIRSARGRTRSLARLRIDNIPTPYIASDSVLTINPYQYTKENKWNGESGKLIIHVPRGKKVILDTELEDDNSYYYNWEDDFFY